MGLGLAYLAVVAAQLGEVLVLLTPLLVCEVAPPLELLGLLGGLLALGTLPLDSLELPHLPGLSRVRVRVRAQGSRLRV